MASHILGTISGRIAADWQTKYRQPLYLLERFVDRQRFAGTCYRAANWIALGRTRGRGRQGPHEPSTSIKDVYVSPLVQEMCALLVFKIPCEQAEPVSARVAGIGFSRSTLAREAQRQGERAIQQRQQLLTSPVHDAGASSHARDCG